MLNIEGKLIKNTQSIADAFNNYFSTVVEESVIKVIKQDNNDPSQNSYMQYLDNAFQQPFSPINLTSVTEKEIHEITHNSYRRTTSS